MTNPLWQLLWLTPTLAQRRALTAGLDAYLASLDPADPLRPWIMEVASGPRTGHLILERGPLRQDDLGRLDRVELSELWTNGVLPHLAALRNELYEQDLALSLSGAPDSPPPTVQVVRFLSLLPGAEAEADRLLAALSERIAEERPGRAWALFRNHLEVGTRGADHRAIASYHADLAELSREFDLDAIAGRELAAELDGVCSDRWSCVMRWRS